MISKDSLKRHIMFECTSPLALISPFFILRRYFWRGFKSEAIKLNGKVLDFGAGSEPYKSLFSNASEYITLDIDSSGYPKEKKNAKYYYDGKTIPFEDNSFDAIFSSEVFEHVPNLEEIICELHRVLKPNGLILLSFPFVWPEHEQPYDFRRFTRYGAEYILEKDKSFKIEKYQTLCNYWETILLLMIFYFFCIPDKLINNKKNPIHLFLRAIMIVIFVVPLNIIGVVAGLILPQESTLFAGQIVLARKSA